MDSKRKIVIEFPLAGKIIKFVDTEENQQLASYLKFLIGTIQHSYILDEQHPFTDRDGNNQTLTVTAPYIFSQAFFDFCKSVPTATMRVELVGDKIETAVPDKNNYSRNLSKENKIKLRAIAYFMGAFSPLNEFYFDVRTSTHETPTDGKLHVDSICGVLAERYPTVFKMFGYPISNLKIRTMNPNFDSCPKLSIFNKTLYFLLGAPYTYELGEQPLVHCRPARPKGVTLLLVFSKDIYRMRFRNLHNATVCPMSLT